MSHLYLTILFPLIGFLLLALSRGRWPENISATIGVGSIAMSFIVAVSVGYTLLTQPTLDGVYVQSLWTWLSVGNFSHPAGCSKRRWFSDSFIRFLVHARR
jgi:NADH-quinone oxidoreductase subunit L